MDDSFILLNENSHLYPGSNDEWSLIFAFSEVTLSEDSLHWWIFCIHLHLPKTIFGLSAKHSFFLKKKDKECLCLYCFHTFMFIWLQWSTSQLSAAQQDWNPVVLSILFLKRNKQLGKTSTNICGECGVTQEALPIQGTFTPMYGSDM